MAETLYEKLRIFFLEHPAAVRAAKPLADGACSWVELEGDPNGYTLLREGGKSILKSGVPQSPDLYFYFSSNAVTYITQGSGDIGDFGRRLYQCVFGGDPACRVEFKPMTSIMTYYRKGYFGILKLAGPEVSKMILQHVLHFIASRGKRWS